MDEAFDGACGLHHGLPAPLSDGTEDDSGDTDGSDGTDGSDDSSVDEEYGACLVHAWHAHHMHMVCTWCMLRMCAGQTRGACMVL